MSYSIDNIRQTSWHECLYQELKAWISAIIKADGELQDTDSSAIGRFLERTKKCEVPDDVQDALARVLYDNRADDDESLIAAESAVQKVLGRMLGHCLADTDISIDTAIRLEDRWHADIDLDEIRHCLAEDKQALEIFYEKMRAVVSDVVMHPESCVIACEQEQFARLLEQWKQEEDIKQVWIPGYGWDHFPAYDPRLRFLNALLPGHISRYLELISELTVPPLLFQLIEDPFVLQNKEVLLALIQKSPVACHTAAGSNRAVWSRQLVAPLILEAVFQNGLQMIANCRQEDRPLANEPACGEAGKEAENDFRTFCSDVAAALCQRSDGWFLAQSYIPVLLRRLQNVKDGCDSSAPETVAQIFLDELRNYFSTGSQQDLPAWTDLFDEVEETAEKNLDEFIETGLLANEKTGIHLDTLRTRLLLDQNVPGNPARTQTWLRIFHLLMAYRESGLYTTQFSPSLPEKSHTDISTLFACQDSPADCWAKTWHLLFGARHRLACHPHQEHANDLRSILNFVLTAGVAAIQQLATTGAYDKIPALDRKVWHGIWNEFIRNDLINRPFFRKLIALHISTFYAVSVHQGENPKTALSSALTRIRQFEHYLEIFFFALETLMKNSPNSAPLLRASEFTSIAQSVYENMQKHIENRGRKRNFHADQRIVRCNSMLEWLKGAGENQ
ncbi:MAG: hypothetical protein ACLFNW_12415 [Desulfobacterales bacterium]